MAFEGSPITSVSPKRTIGRHLLTVSPQASLTEAAALLSQSSDCGFPSGEELFDAGLQCETTPSCVLAIESERLVGLLTSQDLLGLSAQGIRFETTKVADVMTRQTIALKECDFSDIAVAMELFCQHCIQYLPITNDRDQIVGLVTMDSIQNVLQIENRLKIRSLQQEIDFLRAGSVECERLRHRHSACDRDLRSQAEFRSSPEEAREFNDSETHYGSLVEHLSDGLYLLNANFQPIYFNPAIEESFGRPKTYFSANYPERFLSCIHPDDRAQVGEVFFNGNLDRDLIEIKYRIVTPSGEIHYVRDRRQVIRDWYGNVKNYQGIVTDLTVTKQAEATLQQSEQQYYTLAKMSPVGIFRTDAQGDCWYVNQRWQEIAGIELETALGMGWLQAIHPSDRKQVSADWNVAAQTHSPFRAEYRFQRPDGKITWVVGQAVPERSESGDMKGYVGTITDINERKEAEEALRYRNTFERLIASISSYFVNLDSTEIDSGIRWALGQIGQFAGIDRSYVFLFNPDGLTINNTHEWCAEGIRSQIHNLQEIALHAELPWFSEKLQRGEIVHITEVNNLPVLANIDKIHFQMQDILSLLVVPMVLSGGMIGFVGFDSVRSPKIWSEDAIALLRLIGETFANALQRVQAEETLQQLNQDLETKVKQRTAELQRSNEALQQKIVERKQAEQALLGSIATNRALLAAIPDSMFRISRNGTFVNYKATKNGQLPVPLDNLIGKKVVEVLPEPVAQRTLDAVERSLETGELQTFEYQLSGDDDSVTYWEARFAVSSKDEVMAIVREITQRKQAEEELLKALEKEKELNELKSRFVVMTSHEFRTPLSAILGSSELLKHYGHTWDEEKKVLYLDRIHDSVQHMTRMLDDILTLGKAEAGKLEVNPAPIDLMQFCHSLVEELQTGIGKQHQLAFTHSEQPIYEEMRPFLDEKLLRHIFGNLLSNAIKYSPPDSTVELVLSWEASELWFEVRDQGIGIPPEDQQHLFESFHRCKNVGNIPGNGLGLAIVKRSVELCGGTIAVESEIGSGTKFTIAIPIQSAAQE